MHQSRRRRILCHGAGGGQVDQVQCLSCRFKQRQGDINTQLLAFIARSVTSFRGNKGDWSFPETECFLGTEKRKCKVFWEPRKTVRPSSHEICCRWGTKALVLPPLSQPCEETGKETLKGLNVVMTSSSLLQALA